VRAGDLAIADRGCPRQLAARIRIQIGCHRKKYVLNHPIYYFPYRPAGAAGSELTTLSYERRAHPVGGGSPWPTMIERSPTNHALLSELCRESLTASQAFVLAACLMALPCSACRPRSRRDRWPGSAPRFSISSRCRSQITARSNFANGPITDSSNVAIAVSSPVSARVRSLDTTEIERKPGRCRSPLP
jgi:hypothetical protein